MYRRGAPRTYVPEKPFQQEEVKGTSCVVSGGGILADELRTAALELR